MARENTTPHPNAELHNRAIKQLLCEPLLQSFQPGLVDSSRQHSAEGLMDKIHFQSIAGAPVTLLINTTCTSTPSPKNGEMCLTLHVGAQSGGFLERHHIALHQQTYIRSLVKRLNALSA